MWEDSCAVRTMIHCLKKGDFCRGREHHKIGEYLRETLAPSTMFNNGGKQKAEKVCCLDQSLTAREAQAMKKLDPWFPFSHPVSYEAPMLSYILRSRWQGPLPTLKFQ